MRRLLLHVEALEDRSVPTVFTVTSSFDNGLAGTLRWAIIQANVHPNSSNISAYFDPQQDEIHFNVPGKFPFLLQLNAPLPPVTEPVIMNGYTQPRTGVPRGYEGPMIFLDGPMPQDPVSKKYATIFGVVTNDKRVFPPPIDQVPGGRPRPTPKPDPGIVVPLLPKHEPNPPVAVLDRLFFEIAESDDTPPSPARPPAPARRIGDSEPGVFLPGHEELTGKILGELFEDYDGNGLRGSDEPPLPGRVVYLDLNHNGRYDEGEPAAVTNEKGEYRFDDLRPGTYTVKQVLQPHLMQTRPAKGEGNRVGLQAGETVQDVDFGAVRVHRRRVQVDTGSEAQEDREAVPPSDSSGPGEQSETLPGSGAALLALGWGLKPPRKRPDQVD